MIIERTTQGLRDVLFETLEELRSDKITHQKANSICGIASQILNTAKMEMIHERFLKANGNEEEAKKLVPLLLGRQPTV